MKQIGRILRKNRRILKEFHPNGHSHARKQELQSLGFDFSFYTNVDEEAHGRKCFFCFDYGYMPLKNDYFAIVKNKDP
jgi:hypothetical protein